MSNEVTFSIITICRNPGENLAVTEQSLQTQSYGNYEWIVIDGVSTDGTVERMKKNTLVTTLISEPDAGIYDAMNKGTRYAKNDYVYFLNAGDTFYDHTVLSRAAEKLATDSADLLYGDALIVEPETGRSVMRKHDQVDKVYLVTNTITHQSVFAKRDLFKQVGGFDIQFKVKADHDWIIRCWNAGKTFLYLPVPMVRYPADGYSLVNRKKYIDRERELFYSKNFSRLGMLLFRVAYKLKLVKKHTGWIRTWMNKII